MSGDSRKGVVFDVSGVCPSCLMYVVPNDLYCCAMDVCGMSCPLSMSGWSVSSVSSVILRCISSAISKYSWGRLE